MNHCIFVGNMVEDPKVETIKGSTGDVSVAKFRIGVNTRLGKDKTETTFPTIEAWGKSAEIIGQYFKKGDLIRVFARLKTDSWSDKSTGDTRYRDKFVLERFEFPEARKREEQPAEEPEAATKEEEEAPDAGEKEKEAPENVKKGSRKGGGRTERKTVGAGVAAEDESSIPF
jgi:single-strand DNA-binding protein